MFHKQRDDVLEVFNKRWNANHNNGFVKTKKEEEKKFMDSLYDKRKLNMNKGFSMEEKVNNLNNNINIANSGMRKANINNIINKYK